MGSNPVIIALKGYKPLSEKTSFESHKALTLNCEVRRLAVVGYRDIVKTGFLLVSVGSDDTKINRQRNQRNVESYKGEYSRLSIYK